MSETILRVEQLNKFFTDGKTTIRAVSNVSFTVNQGETIGIVGESGCGKTTLGRCIVKAYTPTSGDVWYTAANGKKYNFHTADKAAAQAMRKEVQLIFQDPYSSLDPRMTVYEILCEPLRANYPKMKKEEMERLVQNMAQRVGLNPSYLKRYPHAFSGGQRQRIGIARALLLKPRIVVCDEAVSALDVSVQAQVLSLLRELQADLGLTYLFISHDLSVIEYLSDKVGVMYLGQMVEYSPARELYIHPLHPYTEALLSAVLVADPKAQHRRIELQGEVPNPANPPSGCFFHPRCCYCQKRCREEMPRQREISPGRLVACHRAEELQLQGIIPAGKKEAAEARP